VGANELKSRWLPAVRDGLWHHGIRVADDDVEVCFYGDLFRRAPGTVLSYMALARHPQWKVHTFVTLGSPLASPMVSGMLDPPMVDGKGQWPGSIERWVNVRAVGDAAAKVPVAERFGDRVEDVMVDNGHRAHAAEPYLNAAPTGAAIADALRDRGVSGARRPRCWPAP
jgi:hypothetical protein